MITSWFPIKQRTSNANEVRPERSANAVERLEAVHDAVQHV
jgi:hypothetical protein